MSAQPSTPRPNKVTFGDKLTEDHITLDLKSQSRDDAIREIAHLLKDNEHVVDFDKYLKDVYKRESDASTGIGNGVAIPHARTKSVDDFICAIGRSSSGIDFSAIDGEPVNIIILMGTPLDRLNKYLKLLAHLSHLLKKPGFIQGLIEAPDPHSIIEHFKKHEGLQ